MQDLIDHGVVQRGGIGITLQDLRPELADALDVPVQRGAVIARIGRGSPAENAGLRPGDVITGAAGRTIRSARELINQIGLRRIGEQILLTVQRGQRRFETGVDVQ